MGRTLWTLALLALSTCAQTGAPGDTPTRAAVVSSEFVYAAQDDGTMHVYDLDQHHADVKAIRLFDCCADVRGITAAAPTHRIYVMYNQNDQGHVVCVDLLSDQVVWDHVLHSPGVDRGNVTPDGKTLYLPTWEEDPASPYELAIDAETGTEQARIALPPQSHDTIVSLDGQRVFMETKSSTASLYVADTASNEVSGVVGGYCCSGVLGPFAINGAGTTLVNDVNDYAGFQLAGLGGVTESVPFGSGAGGHGIAWTPDESEVWVNDGGMPVVHVFDMQTTPPNELRPVAVSNVPHWITFSIDGRFAYVAGRKGAGDPTDVIDVPTYRRVGSLGPSEDLLEVEFGGATVAAVGNQFGIGRVTTPAT
ncbi:MAG: hypothetical protein J2P17_08500 [Mycobacterium sp.]|nr:hypothetical protein [Mycobacterium sp.]